jgi:hypothetical protein
MRLEAFVRAFLVFAHQARVACHIVVSLGVV